MPVVQVMYSMFRTKKSLKNIYVLLKWATKIGNNTHTTHPTSSASRQSRAARPATPRAGRRVCGMEPKSRFCGSHENCPRSFSACLCCFKLIFLRMWTSLGRHEAGVPRRTAQSGRDLRHNSRSSALATSSSSGQTSYSTRELAATLLYVTYSVAL